MPSAEAVWFVYCLAVLRLGARVAAPYNTVICNPLARKVFQNMPQNDNLYRVLEEKFIEAAGRPAFMTPDDTEVSYGALMRSVAQMAGALRELGVKPDDRVLVQVDKSIANVVLYLAVLKLGAIYNPLNTAYTAAELDYFMGDAEPVVAVVAGERLKALRPIAERRNVGAVVTLEADGSGTLSDLVEQAAPVETIAQRNSSDVAALIYTSGTTGRSKGAMLTHANLLSNAQVLLDYWGFVEGDVLLHALPIFHVHGLFVALHTAFLNGSAIHWLAKFDAAEVTRLLPKSTVMMGVPTFYTRLLAHADFGKETCRNMRLIISGSAPLLAETHLEFEQRTGHKILERYGMTEAGMITSNPYRSEDGERIAGTVGYALPGIELRIADETGKPLTGDAVGILEIKGPNVFSGYWRNPQKTAEDFREDGFFITGDLAQIAQDGRVSIVGRCKDLIISGGFNIYPKEIEDELNALDGIDESAVIGVPHADFGEGVVAVIVADSCDIAPLLESDIVGALAQRLAKFKLPKRIFTVDELPRNAMGKVQKNELRDRFADSFIS